MGKHSPSYSQIPSNGSLKHQGNDKDQSKTYIHQFSVIERRFLLLIVPAELSNRGISIVKMYTVLLLDLCAVLVAST